MRPRGRWRDHPGRAELRALYAEADALVAGCECRCNAATVREDSLCCHFGLTGREPYPTAVELVEVDLALRARGSARPSRGEKARLPVVPAERACPLLANDGRCTIYESRPFGCRTYFCAGHEPPRQTRAAIQSIGRRLSDLAARLFPRDPLPRPFTRALAGSLPPPPP